MEQRFFEQELMRRVSKNPRYSLRAFAKALGVSHTALSLVMAGKRPPSQRLLERLADNMGLSPHERAKLFKSKSKSLGQKAEYSVIDMDTFHLLADWQHYAVLSLLDLPCSRFEASWISQRLSIPKIEAKLIMERLLRLNLVGEKEGRVQQISGPIAVENKISTSASRRFHQGLLHKASEALENRTMEQRDFSSNTFSMDLKYVNYAREKIRAFRRKLVEELEGKGVPTHVVNLTVQIFPVSH